ncbi:MAG: ABC transporter substrate-binding protein [Methylococcaceae bacterium]|nr:ABC transporter substrate-binding protein [Methylococcaceae bacterium]MCI0734540.1 ABC transporter substrate-binding protein [Methylococcaceae bacterium]
MKRTLILTASLIFLLSLGAAGYFIVVIHEQPNQARQVLRVGYLPITPALPFYVALENGYFADSGLEVEPVKFQNGALMAQEVMAGRLAAASPGPADVYLAGEAEVPGRFRIYLQTAYTPENFIYSLLVRKDSGIKSPKDLKGRKIGVFPGLTNKLLLGLALKAQFGWNPERDVTIVGVAPPLQLDSLETHGIDALCPLEPTGTIGAAREALMFLDKGYVERQVLSPLYITAHALSAEIARKHPEALDHYVKAIEKAVAFMTTHEADARSFLPKYTPLQVDHARLTPLGTVFTVADADRKQFQRLSDLLARERVLTRPVEVEALYYRHDDRN